MATDTLPVPDEIYVVADRADISRIAHGFFWYMKGPAQLHADELNRQRIGVTFRVYKLTIGAMEEA